ncbi:MAG TPA: DUF2785 domain-containing protein [Nocardioides sp.]|nr:DUF2785 domain-containing protein [Nocardioides sp.]
MAKVDWDLLHRRLRQGHVRPPADHQIADLTAELTEMLGSSEPHVRDELALEMLSTWIEQGVYDDLLPGLGDGIATGLMTGLGESGTDTVFRRSSSALVLADVIERDTVQGLVPPAKVLEWGDRLATWFPAERDLRGFVEGKGWAHAVANGADAMGVLARSPHFRDAELAVLLEVIGERATRPADEVWTSGEPDRLARATIGVLHRGLVPLDRVEAWLADVTATALRQRPPSVDDTGSASRRNTVAFLRALYLHLSLGKHHPPGRTDLLLTVIERLRAVQPGFFGR